MTELSTDYWLASQGICLRAGVFSGEKPVLLVDRLDRGLVLFFAVTPTKPCIQCIQSSELDTSFEGSIAQCAS